ncbi:putative flavoprotein [Halobacteroides halobius DSM 5150]|uniref:Putative flavoprotein n=1 Tax=Halobacteroides halobius (strain ATCC 35273 / DSM 5150 / MD-1) TaxID=748449 RepID=L0K8G0_HALHC|nr:flavodoxin domain-containing protein [Halobacteroides halobius]AGB40408.1 putative flavoprotein [Halobacteroides halobius DSM 5150]
MGSFKVKENIYWVGARDWNLRSFHGPAFNTPHGTTYNAYLIKDEKNVLVDGVHKPFTDTLFEHIQEVIDWEDIDYYIVNHAEPDHSGSFPATMEKLRDDVTVVCTASGKNNLLEHYGDSYNYQVINSGDTIDIGARTLSFLEASMLHWPDSMFTYIPEDKLLLPNDAFGMHLCVSSLFDDQNDQNLLIKEAKKYFANILTPFSDLVLKKLNEVEEMGLEIDIIAPSHGIIWRENPEEIINKYVEWAEMKPKKKAVVIYETMWDSTELVAQKIVEGLIDAGIEVNFYRKSISDKNDIVTEILDAKAVIVGSPTINNVMIPAVTPILEELEGLRFKNKLGAAFGSKGWAGGAAQRIADRLEKAKINLVGEPFEFKYVPNEEKLDEAYQLGEKIAEKINKSK